MLGQRHDPMLKAFTGLEGGVVAAGSTCGVVSGGAVSLALMRLDELTKDKAGTETAVLEQVRDYTRWFERQYGSFLCRNRSGVDFYSPGGQIRYLLPGDRVGKCLWHIRGAVRYIQGVTDRPLPVTPGKSAAATEDVPHCAGSVLKKIRERTGLGDDALDRVAFVFDGGVGLSGGVCGALAGAILGLNLLLGLDVRSISFFRITRAFVAGHLNLLSDRPPDRAEPFYVGKTVVARFFKEAAAMECATISGRQFSSPADFQDHLRASDTCRRLIDRAADLAVAAIEKWR